MKFIVKTFNIEVDEMEFLATGEEKEISFVYVKHAAFIEGIRISIPDTWQYRIIPKEQKQK